MELLKRLIEGKEKANDTRYEYMSVSYLGDYWGADILEARGKEDGLPIKAFADVSDKFVLHPGHLYSEKFDYFWTHTWGDDSCWDKKVLNSEKDEINAGLVEVARLIESMGIPVYIVDINGSNKGYNKGYNSTKCCLPSEFILDPESYRKDLVIFVYLSDVNELKESCKL